MSNGGDLLRMLMPAVRPVPTDGVRPAKQPIESQSFDALLREANQTELSPRTQTDPKVPTDPVSPTDPTQLVAPTAKPDTLAALSGLDAIHNASIRRIVAEANGN